MRRMMGALAVVYMALAGTAVADPINPPQGSRVVLTLGQSIPAQFSCSLITGGLTVQQTADFVNEWRTVPSTVTESAGVCSVTLFQFPASSPAQDEEPHVYFWRTRQCFAKGTCSDNEAIFGSVWSFTVERPPRLAPTTPSSPSSPPSSAPQATPAPAAPPPPEGADPEGPARCEEAKYREREIIKHVSAITRERQVGHTARRDAMLRKKLRQTKTRLRRSERAVNRFC